MALFRCGGSANNNYRTNYKTYYTGNWGYNSAGYNIRTVAKYPIFNNKNLDVMCGYVNISGNDITNTSMRFKTLVKLLDKSGDIIESFEKSTGNTQKINVNLSEYSNVDYFLLEFGTYDHSGVNAGKVNVTIDVY